MSWEVLEDPLSRDYFRALYTRDPITGEWTTDTSMLNVMK
jgi:hypothetical protein